MELKDINECTLVKLRNYGMCVLLKRGDDETFYGLEQFRNKEIRDFGVVSKSSIDTNLKYKHTSWITGKEFDIVAIKKFDNQLMPIQHILKSVEPSKWDWEENSKKDEVQALINKLTEQLKQAKCELEKL